MLYYFFDKDDPKSNVNEYLEDQFNAHLLDIPYELLRKMPWLKRDKKDDENEPWHRNPVKCSNCGGWKYRKNSDEELRRLERKAILGDPEEKERYRRALQRARITSQGPRIAFKVIDRLTPWEGPGTTSKVVNLEDALRSGPPSASIPTLWSNKRVWWSINYNSYVMVIPDQGEQAQFWHETEGNVNLASVNGVGEVRWWVFADDAARYPNTSSGGEGAAQAFGLSD